MAQIDPSKPSGDYEAQKSFWDMADDIMAGLDAMRDRGEVYLPRFDSESQKDYQARLQESPWTPIYADSFRNLVSKPFAKELTLEEDAGPDYAELAENIDAKGNNLHVFSREAFKAAVNAGIAWIWVGHTEVPEGATRADARAAGARPFWRMIAPRNVLAVYSDIIEGAEALTHVRLDETHTVREGFKERTVKQVRVIERAELEGGGYGPPVYQVYQKIKGRNLKESWEVVAEGAISLPVIPLVPIIVGERQARWKVRPPLKDLAYMQVRLYQMESNHAVVQTNTAFPVNVIQGVDEAPQTLGPRTVLSFPPINDNGAYGDFRREEPSGTAAASLREDIAAHKREMREAGMQPLVPQTGNLTATATAVSEAKAHSAVQAWALALKDALENAWKLTALWMDRPADEPTVSVHTDFQAAGQGVEEFRAILDMAAPDRQLISNEQAVMEAKRRGLLSPDYDLDEDRERILLEATGGDDADLEEAGAL